MTEIAGTVLSTFDLPVCADGNEKQWSLRIARWISNLACPPILGTAGIAALALHAGSLSAWCWMGIFLCIAIGIPLLFLGLMMAKGIILDFHIPNRKQRILPLAVSVVCAAAASAVLAWRQAPRIWIHLSILWMAISAVFILITLVWKISGHSATVTGLSTILIFSIGASVWWLALSVPVMAWARVSLRRHTLRQTLAGSLLGFAAGAALVLWNGRIF